LRTSCNARSTVGSASFAFFTLCEVYPVFWTTV